MEHTLAGGRAGLPVARILALERGLTRRQGTKDGFRHVVSAVLAMRIETGNVEQCGGVLDHDASDVRGLRNAASRLVLLDIEPETLECGHPLNEAGCTVFTTPALLGALKSFAAALPETIHTFHCSSIPEVRRNALGSSRSRGSDRGADAW